MVRVATRGSALARWQARRLVELLGSPPHEFVIVATAGDANQAVPIHAIGGQGVFVKEVQAAVLSGAADVAVHSAKDLPAATPEGLVLAAIPERADPRDALVGSSLEDLPLGAIVGTGAVRRRAQLGALRPDLRFAELRGNVDTRLAKVGEFTAVVLACAGLIRLGRSDAITEALSTSVVVPQVGQGALAVECRADDTATLAALAAIDDRAAHVAVAAEREVLRAFGAGCDFPVGAHATLTVNGAIELEAFAEVDGHPRRARGVANDGSELARRVVDELRAAS